jgi:pimeloyl-ACP methyl ester carboxylesterase
MNTIYTSPEFAARLMALYDARLERWPVPYESVFVDTTYGSVHVIASGPQDAPPLLLLHAGGQSATMWLYNVEDLSHHYRTYAVDHIGEAGRSVLDDLNHFPRDTQALADLYVEICDGLGVGQSYVVGASNGGYIATSLALHVPERVGKVALLSPAGIAPFKLTTLLKLMLFGILPIRSFKERLSHWGLGDHPRVLGACGEWVRLMMDGVRPRTAPSKPFTPDQLRSLGVPVLLVVGRQDEVLGDPERVKRFAQQVPGIQIEMLDAGHLMSIEWPDDVNARIRAFFGQPSRRLQSMIPAS